MQLRFENSTKLRYYLLVLTRDLFGDWVIIKSWGGLNKSGGRLFTKACASYEEALSAIEVIKRTRSKRGYQLVTPT